MRPKWFILTALASLLFLTQCMGKEAVEEKEKLHKLGEQLIDSLKDDNIVAYSQCWITWPAAYRMAVRSRIPESILKNHRKFMLGRDREIARLFQPLRQRLLKLTPDLSQLKLESISGPIQEDDATHALVSDPLVICIRVDANTLVEWEALGAKIADDWLFSGIPESYIKIIKHGKSETVDIVLDQRG